MAQYRYNQGFVKRSQGQSAVGKAAYNSREVIKDERLNKTFHYQNLKEDFIHAEIIAPHNAPDWAKIRSTLWNKAEGVENQKNSQTAMNVNLMLPRELTDQQNIELVKDFVHKNYTSKGIISDVSIHKSVARDGDFNPHAHILLTTRKLDGDDFAKKKARDWQTKPQLKRWREQWTEVQNSHLKQHGYSASVDDRTLEEQSIDRIPTKHEGKVITALRKKGITNDKDGKEYDRMDDNFFINHKNRVRRAARIYEPETVRKELVLSDEKMRDYSPEMKAHMEKVKRIVENTEFLTEAEQDRQKSNVSIFMQKTAYYARSMSNAIKERLTSEKGKDIEYSR